MPESRVEGLDETLTMLDGLPKALVLGGYNKALWSAANVIKGKLEPIVPMRREEDLSVASSALKEAIRCASHSGPLRHDLLREPGCFAGLLAPSTRGSICSNGVAMPPEIPKTSRAALRPPKPRGGLKPA